MTSAIVKFSMRIFFLIKLYFILSVYYIYFTRPVLLLTFLLFICAKHLPLDLVQTSDFMLFHVAGNIPFIY